MKKRIIIAIFFAFFGYAIKNIAKEIEIEEGIILGSINKKYKKEMHGLKVQGFCDNFASFSKEIKVKKRNCKNKEYKNFIKIKNDIFSEENIAYCEVVYLCTHVPIDDEQAYNIYINNTDRFPKKSLSKKNSKIKHILLSKSKRLSQKGINRLRIVSSASRVEMKDKKIKKKDNFGKRKSMIY